VSHFFPNSLVPLA